MTTIAAKPKPKNIDGFTEIDPDGSYRRFQVGPVIVRGYEDFEPDGELVTTEPVRVHIEQMDDGFWWIGLSWTDTEGEEHQVAVDFTSKKPIKVFWRDDG